MAPSADRTEISARLLILTEDRVLLAGHRGRTWYFLPGGRLSPGETIEHALRRGTGQETGFDIRALDFVGCVEHDYSVGTDKVHELMTVFAAPLPWAAQIISHDPELHLFSVDLDDLARRDLRPAALKNMIFDWVRDARPAWRTSLPAG
ncbi:NUDIX domain-containing protein [Pseudofrankia inefficax]|uniref:NUDIX hydrolase n=1 Tax=Pseudofrankia inefficax (strain DSM 45817 / CECT 9037 / DDB 130130 / EuI1c) TaxID=298654 RepID=E3J342_PSEI1|nr:NUDIX domain-containing protein [Pseudofrankia inefficax]ADP82992.1 NUDIX hydrolase [Pseudofrankia inefficax]